MSFEIPSEVHELYTEEFERILVDKFSDYRERLNVIFWIMFPCPSLANYNGLLMNLANYDDLENNDYDQEYPAYVGDMIRVYKFRLMIASQVYNGLDITDEIGKLEDVISDECKFYSDDEFTSEYAIYELVEEVLGEDKRHYFTKNS